MEVGKHGIDRIDVNDNIATIYTEVPINTDLENIHYNGINALEYISFARLISRGIR